MKQLIRRLSRVADSSSQYCLLRSAAAAAESSSSSSSRPSRTDSFRAKLRRRASHSETSSSSSAVPSGHVPVYVGEEMERFVVSAEVLNHPVFVELLEKYSAGEYGYEQPGVLRIPCHVILFERVLEALRLGHVPQTRDLRDLLAAESELDFGLYGVVSA